MANPEPTVLNTNDYGTYTSDNELVSNNESTQDKNLLT